MLNFIKLPENIIPAFYGINQPAGKKQNGYHRALYKVNKHNKVVIQCLFGRQKFNITRSVYKEAIAYKYRKKAHQKP
jgi:hypothetical protein